MINTHPNRVLSPSIIELLSANLRHYIAIFVLMALVFLSALALVYVNDIHRQLMIKRDSLNTRSVAIHNHWGQLLKQQSQLSNEMTIANEAKYKLAMTVPGKPHIVTVEQ